MLGAQKSWTRSLRVTGSRVATRTSVSVCLSVKKLVDLNVAFDQFAAERRLDEELDDYFQKHQKEQQLEQEVAREQSEAGYGEYAEFNDNPEERGTAGTKAIQSVRKVTQVQNTASAAPEIDIKE